MIVAKLVQYHGANGEVFNIDERLELVNTLGVDIELEYVKDNTSVSYNIMCGNTIVNVKACLKGDIVTWSSHEGNNFDSSIEALVGSFKELHLLNGDNMSMLFKNIKGQTWLTYKEFERCKHIVGIRLREPTSTHNDSIEYRLLYYPLNILSDDTYICVCGEESKYCRVGYYGYDDKGNVIFDIGITEQTISDE